MLSDHIHVDIGIFFFFLFGILGWLFGFQDSRVVGSDERGFCVPPIIINGIFVGGVIEWVNDDGAKLAFLSFIVSVEAMANLFPLIQIPLL